jgi:hypothetical protein
MNPRINDGSLSLPLHANLILSRSTTERDNRHHDRCPRDIDSGVPISVIGVAARDTTKSGLTLAVRFCRVAAHMARARRVARVNRVQWHTSKSGLVGSTQLTIHQFLQFKRIGRLFRKSDFCHIGSCLVKGVQGVKQSLMLFSCCVKLQEHRLFHVPSIHLLMKTVSRHGIFCLRAAFFPPCLKRTGHPERPFCKTR